MNEYINSLRSFCSWCVDYEYLAHNPFQALRLLDGETEVERRALMVDEIHLLLTCAPPERRILYETVFLTGMRANECRQLTLHHLNLKAGVILLAAEWTKGRRECEQPAPRWFLQRLHAFGEQKTADSLYRRYRTNRSRLKVPAEPLFFLPCEPARSLEIDLRKAGLEKNSRQGRMDFHGLRTTFATLLDEVGARTKPKKFCCAIGL